MAVGWLRQKIVELRVMSFNGTIYNIRAQLTVSNVTGYLHNSVPGQSNLKRGFESTESSFPLGTRVEMVGA
jgi:hypothetical protein